MSNTSLKYSNVSEEELRSIAKDILNKNYSNIVCLRGNLGAGKTALVKAFCAELECKDRISSPTFSIVNEYACQTFKIYHIDLYRLNNFDEAMEIGMEDYLATQNYCFIEWPDLIMGILPERYVDVLIESTDSNSRNLLISFQ